MDTSCKNITNFFSELLNDLECQYDTKSYIISIYGKYKIADQDLSKESITLLFAQARNKQDFLTYQKIGDWIFFINSISSKHLHNASKDYYDNIARESYYSCYKIVNRQWKLYEQLADDFPKLEAQVRNKLQTLVL